MAESTTEDKVKFYGIFALVVILIAGGVAAVLSYMKNQAAKVKTASEDSADKKLAATQAAALGIDPGRAEAMIGAARTIYNQVTQSHWYSGGVSSSECVAALNLAQSPDEMTAMSTAYNVQISNNQNDLKADVDAHVLGVLTDSSQITYYNNIV